jgi:acyl-ACP thioesterase
MRGRARLTPAGAARPWTAYAGLVESDGLSELVPAPERGRVFTQSMRPGLGDCAPSGRIRLDALARWLQDVAYADVEDAGIAQLAVWVVRRTRISVSRFPRFAERFMVQTFCSGLGRMWAERRTTIADAQRGTPVVEAVALWVHLDPLNWRPAGFTDQEITAYGDAAGSRRVSARLRHPAPTGSMNGSRWLFRATECDLAGHINNAAYWQPLEEELLQQGPEPERLDAEIEFRTPTQPGEKLVVSNGRHRWIVAAEGETHASAIVLTG